MSGVSFPQLIQQIKGAIKEITPEEVQERLKAGEPWALLDVREQSEWEEGHLPEAHFIPRGFLEIRTESTLPEKDKPLVVYCAGGVRSAMAAKTLQDMGYTNVVSMSGGFTRWRELDYSFTKPRTLTDMEMERYSRQIRIPEVGIKGQTKLLDSKVLLIGAGGLGCPSAIYLAAAGVGTIGIVDNDVVDLSNLQRQILHHTSSLGTPKTESAKAALHAINPSIEVNTYQEKLSSANVMEIIEPYDIIVDGSDNFPTRYLINDACVWTGKPNVHGSVFRFEGQVTLFNPYQGPCYRCLYPNPTPPDLAPSCADAGVLGVLPGVVGLLQAVETIKFIIGEGDSLAGRLITYDALTTSFREFKLRRDLGCPVCGENPTITEFIDYEEFCADAVDG
ncbi:MAG: molybdopterin-synthase adenylyltransferase MoeB [bacterium]|nr:molybdopterin-synthase adenylyltransferase MoeB [bacterium]MDV2479136.1 molybdopterin-synthase adenylyltransferase MoeB [bacterium]